MTDLQIDEYSIPVLAGKVALITGGSSGIGHATAEILASHGAKVYILDIHPPSEHDVHHKTESSSIIRYRECNVAIWADLRRTFLEIGHIDMVFANAGVSETEPFLPMIPSADPPTSTSTSDSDNQDEDEEDEEEPTYPLIDVNFRSVLNIIKLCWRTMKPQEEGGRIVLTTSATGYAPEMGLPVYSAIKAALIHLVRSLSPLLLPSNITINAVAPSATETPLVPRELLTPIIAAGLPVSTAHFVGLALVYSAVAETEEDKENGVKYQRTDMYGKDIHVNEHLYLHKDDDGHKINGNENENEDSGTKGVRSTGGDEDNKSKKKDRGKRRWNGKVIMTLGNTYTEIEGPLAEFRPTWLGKENWRLIMAQQAQTDFRDLRGLC